MATCLVRRAGFTLIELLVVVGIMALLLSLVGIVAQNAYKKAQLNRARGLVRRIQACVDQYNRRYGSYPPTQYETWPQPDYTPGVELDNRWLKECEVSFAFNKDDLDRTDDNFFIDPWKHRIRYRKSSPDRMMIWSLGPDGIDQVGADTTGHRERKGDDISNMDAD